MSADRATLEPSHVTRLPLMASGHTCAPNVPGDKCRRPGHGTRARPRARRLDHPPRRSLGRVPGLRGQPFRASRRARRVAGPDRLSRIALAVACVTVGGMRWMPRPGALLLAARARLSFGGAGPPPKLRALLADLRRRNVPHTVWPRVLPNPVLGETVTTAIVPGGDATQHSVCSAWRPVSNPDRGTGPVPD